MPESSPTPLRDLLVQIRAFLAWDALGSRHVHSEALARLDDAVKHLQHELVDPVEEVEDSFEGGYFACCSCGWTSGPHGSTPAAMYAAYAMHLGEAQMAALAALVGDNE